MKKNDAVLPLTVGAFVVDMSRAGFLPFSFTISLFYSVAFTDIKVMLNQCFTRPALHDTLSHWQKFASGIFANVTVK